MGGRGGRGENSPSGRKAKFGVVVENIRKSSDEELLQGLKSLGFKASDPRMDSLGNVVTFQSANLKIGEYEASLRFYNSYDPRQVGAVRESITQSIEIVTWKNGNPTAIRKIAEKKSKSVKNARKNYEEMLSQWKKIVK